METITRAVIAAIALLATACGSTPVAPAAGRQSLTIGFLGDSPDKSASGGQNGAKLAVDEYNLHADSTYRVSLRAVENAGTPAEAAQAATQLAKTQRLIGVVGELGEAASEAVAPVLEQAGMPFLTTSASAAPAARTFRRLVATNVQQGKAMARYANKAFAAGPVFVMHDDSAEGNEFSEGLKGALDAAKRPIARFERVGPKTDLGGLAGSIASAPPPILFFAGEGSLASRLVEASRKAGFKGPIVVSPSILTAKPSGVPDAVVTDFPAADLADAAVGKFRARYRSKFGSKPPPFALESFEGASMLLEAVEEVEPKPKEIVEFFRLNRSFLGDSKDYEYDENGELRTVAVWLYQAKAGAWTFIGRSPTAAKTK